MDNPEYIPDSEIYKYDSFGVLGLDLWQVRSFGSQTLHSSHKVGCNEMVTGC